MVTPPAFSAAIPVGAIIMNSLCVLAAKLCKKVVFPVPAFPVKKTWLAVLLTNFALRFIKSVSSVSMR